MENKISYQIYAVVANAVQYQKKTIFLFKTNLNVEKVEKKAIRKCRVVDRLKATMGLIFTSRL